MNPGRVDVLGKWHAHLYSLAYILSANFNLIIREYLWVYHLIATLKSTFQQKSYYIPIHSRMAFTILQCLTI